MPFRLVPEPCLFSTNTLLQENASHARNSGTRFLKTCGLSCSLKLCKERRPHSWDVQISAWVHVHLCCCPPSPAFTGLSLSIHKLCTLYHSRSSHLSNSYSWNISLYTHLTYVTLGRSQRSSAAIDHVLVHLPVFTHLYDGHHRTDDAMAIACQ